MAGSVTAAAWLSSVRVVRRPVKSGNERNPCRVLNIHTRLLFLFGGRKEGTTSNQHGAYAQGYTHGVMDETTGRDGVILS